MKNILKVLFIFFGTLNLFGCNSYEYNEKFKDSNISIDKIGLDMKYDILSIEEDVNGVVMFEECGRPDIGKSNTVIGAHSGRARNAYFNEIHKLEVGDEIKVTYNDIEYVYIVEEVKEVNDTEVEVLEDKGKSMLTLLTCKIGDSSKRIIVICDMINGKN